MSWLARIFEKVHPEEESPVSRKLHELKGLDRKLKVFGASSHRYKATPASEAELAELDRLCGLPVPAEFRRHLATVGHGAGPYYGVWGPRNIRREIDLLYQDAIGEAGVTASPVRPFPLSLADAQMIEARKLRGQKEPWITATWPMDGCIPICHQGCTYWTALVVSGDLAGRMWDVASDTSGEGLWLPSTRPTGCLLKRAELEPLPALPSPPTFEDWFMGWLERAITDLSA